MGYTTSFYGGFELNIPMKPIHKLYINRFSGLRRNQKYNDKLPEDPLRKIVNLPIGTDGEFFVQSSHHPFDLWSPETHYLFNNEFQKIVLTLLCINKYHFDYIDKNIFFNIIKIISNDIYHRNFDLLENVKLIKLDSEENKYHDPSNKNYNEPPGQPGLWCQWIVESNMDGKDVIRWDGVEKFYNYIDWLEYMIEKFFNPWGYILNGVVRFQGEYSDDCGQIIINNNYISVEETQNSDDEFSDHSSFENNQ